MCRVTPAIRLVVKNEGGGAKKPHWQVGFFIRFGIQSIWHNQSSVRVLYKSDRFCTNPTNLLCCRPNFPQRIIILYKSDQFVKS